MKPVDDGHGSRLALARLVRGRPILRVLKLQLPLFGAVLCQSAVRMRQDDCLKLAFGKGVSSASLNTNALCSIIYIGVSR